MSDIANMEGKQFLICNSFIIMYVHIEYCIYNDFEFAIEIKSL